MTNFAVAGYASGVTGDHDALRRSLGRLGAWTFAFDGIPASRVRTEAAQLETLGYSALWVPEGSSSRDVFAHLALLLAATDRMTVASGIANITARQPEVMARGARTVVDGWGNRAVVGIGVGHEYSTKERGIAWAQPLSRMRTYLDRMDAAPWGWEPHVDPPRLIAALGNGMLRLAAERALGAHTYFVPVSHTAHAREVMGPEPVLAVEITAVAEKDPSRARRQARGWAAHYPRNLVRMGFAEEELAGGGSDRLIDATVAWGDAADVAERVRAHLLAGADHVCVQFVGDELGVDIPAYEALADAWSATP
jgi:probable F420-dependent oxidoreductase